MEPSSDGTKRGPEPTYWERLAKTIFINIAFLLALGLYEGARGPTLLDLTEIYQTDVETISFMFLISSVGSLIGAFFTGWIMDKYPGFQAQFMFIFTFLLGAIAILFPFLGHLYVFFAAIFVAGFNSGALDTAVTEQWAAMSEDYLKSTCRDFRRRLQDVIKAEGRHIQD
eukprot:maker-scaffold61_size441589-snap-gene-3.36 protein:Tk06320 transcript:maker-scaffold61_size441589-snap-gene-3.36-mRNA-1 annotation:"hypothetical protein LOTGIDRAFT_237460"